MYSHPTHELSSGRGAEELTVYGWNPKVSALLMKIVMKSYVSLVLVILTNIFEVKGEEFHPMISHITQNYCIKIFTSVFEWLSILFKTP